MNDAEFGRYLASVAERDIDLLLMEEFSINDEFVAWFCARLGLPDAKPRGAWHSVSDADGETDLLLLVVVGGSRIGIMIENKISAPEQDKQACDHDHTSARSVGTCASTRRTEPVAARAGGIIDRIVMASAAGANLGRRRICIVNKPKCGRIQS